MDVERAEPGDDEEVGQDEGPASGPGAPEAGAEIGDEDADLDGERTGQRLRNGDDVGISSLPSQRRSWTSSFSMRPTSATGPPKPRVPSRRK